MQHKTYSALPKTLGIIGFGSFGQFISTHLTPYFDVYVTDKQDKTEEANKSGVRYKELKEVVAKEILVICVPAQYMENTLLEIKKHIKPTTLVLDVSSVKVKPIALMKRILPSTVEIIGTHPLFGPQSGKNGIEGLNCVVCHENTKSSTFVTRFLKNELKLNVLERSADTHDKQMAYVQALTHFVGRAVNEMDIPDVDQKTDAYQYLLNIKKNLGKDSFELFKTIEVENPYAKSVREHFMKELIKLHGLVE